MADFGRLGQQVSITGGAYVGLNGIIHRTHIDVDNEVRINIAGESEAYHYVSVRSLSLQTSTTVNTSSDNWEFKSVVRADIDFQLLQDSLTKANPLLLIERGDAQLVFIHISLRNKMALLQIDTIPEGVEQEYVPNLFLIKTHFSDWVKWAKEIKNATWPKELRDPQVVKVHQPKI